MGGEVAFEGVAERARQVLSEAVELLERICDDSLLAAIGSGTFGVTRRPPDGGKGLERFCLQQAAARAYAAYLELLCINGRAVNWTRIDFVWY